MGLHGQIDQHHDAVMSYKIQRIYMAFYHCINIRHPGPFAVRHTRNPMTRAANQGRYRDPVRFLHLEGCRYSFESVHSVSHICLLWSFCTNTCGFQRP